MLLVLIFFTTSAPTNSASTHYVLVETLWRNERTISKPYNISDDHSLESLLSEEYRYGSN